MSNKSPAQKSVYAAVQHMGGARSTRAASVRTCMKFIEFCQSTGSPIQHMKTVTFEQVQAFINFLKSPPPDSGRKALTTASLHNTVAQIRACMTALHGKPDQKGITAKNLGLPTRSRKGTKEPIPDEMFLDAVTKAELAGEVGFALVLRLERYFGHRSLEALMSGREIKKYITELEDGMRINQLSAMAPGDSVFPDLPVTDGAKSGRFRKTAFIAKYAVQSIKTLLDTLTYFNAHKFLVEGKKKGLKSCLARARYLAKKCGLVGKYSMHSIRYRYAEDKLIEYRDAGLDRLDAFRLVTAHLGHGETRANALIAGVYCQNAAKTFPKMPRKRDLSVPVEQLTAMLNAAYAAKPYPEPEPALRTCAPDQIPPNQASSGGV